MLRRIEVWHVMVADGVAGMVAAGLLALWIHFPDTARRLEPPPVNALWVVFGSFTAAVVLLAAMRVGVSRRGFSGLLIGSIALWLCECYALFFIWLNTYGT
jgi:hypothetical protein